MIVILGNCAGLYMIPWSRLHSHCAESSFRINIFHAGRKTLIRLNAAIIVRGNYLLSRARTSLQVDVTHAGNTMRTNDDDTAQDRGIPELPYASSIVS